MNDEEQRVFAALADSTRRQIIEKLSSGGEFTATDLARQLPITRQGVAKHLGILAEAALVSSRREGRETIYALNPDPLENTITWVETVTAAWDRRLRALQDYLLGDDDEEAQPP